MSMCPLFRVPLLTVQFLEDLDSGLPKQSALHNYSISIQDYWFFVLFFILIVIFLIAFLLIERIKEFSKQLIEKNQKSNNLNPREYLKRLNSQQLLRILNYKRNQKGPLSLVFLLSAGLLFVPDATFAQQANGSILSGEIWSKAGVIITLILLSIPIIFAIVLFYTRITRRLGKLKDTIQQEEAQQAASSIDSASLQEIEGLLVEQQQAADYRVPADSLSGNSEAKDHKGLLSVNEEHDIPIVSRKKKATQRPKIDPDLAHMVIWFLGSATFWLLFGTTIGEYIGIKFVAPDLDHQSWLSFGRLRPVHTNSVFWGWASLGMIGLAYYVVPRVSNCRLYSMRLGWITLWLINASVILGSIALMAGINNGGGEYREYIWPIMLLFAIALVLTLINFYKTIGNRKTTEIYISNWYIVSAIIFTIIIVLVAYLPFWQIGLGETIVQGYYMHQGVGMWFMLFTLGLIYYFLPQQLNKPIYSYSLGILAFWTQILFYTLIGSHHFVFSSIPWWLQTVAIVGSGGMAIPVIAGTTNFLMTFKGAWFKINDSYTLPFFLVGIIFYFTGSMQGTAEAFRETNLIWHFTDFTVAHSHLTMYGIICFFLWACMYAIIPRFTGKEAPQITIGAHFWLALIGMMFYTIPLMYGSTLKGLAWLDGKPFIDSVVSMAPYWLWRAVGGSLMWISHLFFAYNFYKMVSVRKEINFGEEIVERLENQHNSQQAQ